VGKIDLFERVALEVFMQLISAGMHYEEASERSVQCSADFCDSVKKHKSAKFMEDNNLKTQEDVTRYYQEKYINKIEKIRIPKTITETLTEFFTNITGRK